MNEEKKIKLNTDIILKANSLLKDPKKHIYLFGAENRLYVHHKLKELNFSDYWKGKFPKNLSPTYEDSSILKDAKYMIDMSVIKGDGGGTQYTFLEAIHQDTLLILHNDWINAGSTFQSGYNCIGVSTGEELAEVIGKDIAKKIISKGIKDVSFDRGKYKYHGLIKILAEAARTEGLNF